MPRELSGGDTKDVQEYTYEGETDVDKVGGKVIKRRKSYNIAFRIEVVISHEEIN